MLSAGRPIAGPLARPDGRLTSTGTSMAMALPMTDILPLVLQHLSSDLASLCTCALVDRNSYKASSALLYRHIVFSPPGAATLDLNEAQKYSVRSHRMTMVHKFDSPSCWAAACVSATGNHPALRCTPPQCRLCDDCGNWRYDRRLQTTRTHFKPN